jgi:hypothetical protein
MRQRADGIIFLSVRLSFFYDIDEKNSINIISVFQFFIYNFVYKN